MRTLPTREVIKTTPRTRIIRLDLGASAFPFRAGQAVLVGLHHSPLRKPYSIASSPKQTADSGALELLVLLDEAGVPDPHIERLKPGMLVDVDGPFGAFGLSVERPDQDILFVAGGTGIAPLRSMLWDTVEQGAANRLTLVYSARSADEFAYEHDLRRLAADRRLDLRITVTREGAQGWMGSRGRIDATLIQSVIKSADTRAVLCGPPSMIDAVRALLRAAGVADRDILTEPSAA